MPSSSIDKKIHLGSDVNKNGCIKNSHYTYAGMSKKQNENCKMDNPMIQ
jgi:hypothetical protein